MSASSAPLTFCQQIHSLTNIFITEFIPENNIIRGIQVDGSHDTYRQIMPGKNGAFDIVKFGIHGIRNDTFFIAGDPVQGVARDVKIDESSGFYLEFKAGENGTFVARSLIPTFLN